MMYGDLKPTPEEMMALLAHYVEPLPIIGTAVTIQKTIVSYQNGKTMEALIKSGVVAFRVVGDVLLVKEIWKTAVEFSFTDDAMEILTTSAVGQMDDAARIELITKLDEFSKMDKFIGGRNKVTELLGTMPELTGSTRDKLLLMIQDADLREIVNELYRPIATIGDGGTAAALVSEFYEGNSRH